MGLIEALIMALIYIIVIVAICAIVLWAITKFLPEFERPARYVVGAIAVILILLILLKVIQGGMPPLT